MTPPATRPARTAELRWFCAGPLPDDVAAWFRALADADLRLGDPSPPEMRADVYLPPPDDALGLKWRPGAEGRPAAIETKRREAVGGWVRAGRAAARAETWAKWSLPLADGVGAPSGWRRVDKARRQHRDGAPGAGCALELTTLSVDGAAWWSVALEATGPTADARRRWLLHGATRWLARPDAPALDGADARGYPAWLRTVDSRP